MTPLLIALLAYIGWGTGDIFGTLATRKIGGFSTVFWMFALRSIFMLGLAPLFISQFSSLNSNVILFSLGLGVIKIIGEISYFEALRINSASIVGTIGATFSAVVVILSVLFLGESASLNQSITIFIVLIGLVLCTLNFRDLKKSSVFNLGTALSFLAMLFWGIYFTFIKLPINQTGSWFWPSYISFLTFPLIYLYLRIRKYSLKVPFKHISFLPVFMVAFLIALGDFSFNIANSIGLTALVAPVAGAYPTLFVTLAFFIFKDPITKQQILGIITTLVGIVLLSFFSI